MFVKECVFLIRYNFISLIFIFQVFFYIVDKEIRIDDLCLDVFRFSGFVIMLKCYYMRGNQLWEYDVEVGYFL